MHMKLKTANKSAAGFTLGRGRFAKISAVEGIHLSGSMEKDLREFERKGLSAEERRKVISGKYGTKHPQFKDYYND
jgi:hypothetical protein